MRRLLVLAVLLGASAARAENPSALEWSALAVAEASLLGDALQTMDIKRHTNGSQVFQTWEDRSRFDGVPPNYETNAILGQHPGDAKVIAYFAGAGLATAASWYILPHGWRFLSPALVLALEIPQMVRNAHAGMSIHF